VNHMLDPRYKYHNEQWIEWGIDIVSVWWLEDDIMKYKEKCPYGIC